MRVSYVELFIHCKKVFRACGIPYGCADDGAEVVTWSEFIGLNGMQVLLDEIPNINPPGMESIHLLQEEKGLYRFDGRRQSAIILGKLMADFALGMSETKRTVRVYMQNTTRSRLLAQPAHYIASRGKGCLVNYKTREGKPMWILSTPEIAFPFFAEGDAAEQIMEQNLTADLGQYETASMTSDGFWLVCTSETTWITSCIRKLRQAAENRTMQLTESVHLKATFEKTYLQGAKIDMHHWNELDQIGRETLVKASGNA
ncbi:DUF3726 domain-containing protein [Oceanobacillus timonensis]|uniref:DUF3726 domain-containing protein n=1 Tax=Oceanobacillus timonensis TaxID=1926285 RepID=UPI0009BB878F|nr:DUF3726 domain-containing protein [Oceanobacillus timonensis]